MIMTFVQPCEKIEPNKCFPEVYCQITHPVLVDLHSTLAIGLHKSGFSSEPEFLAVE